MKKRILLIGCALAAGIGPAAAQLTVEGRVINAPYFSPEHRLIFSQNDYIYGTSRTAAMGGAFASLGADLSTMNINPAGLGMYQSSDWGITQSLSINTMKTDSPNMASGSLYSGGGRTSYGLNNAAMAFNLFNRSRGLTSLTLGFGYNRAANFNSRSYFNTYGERTSIAEMFQDQLRLMYNPQQGDPVTPDDLKPSSYPFENLGIYLDEWGAVLGYQTGLVGFNGGQYNMLAGITPADTYFQSVTKGGIYEYTFSVGANISNILYLGATIGAAQINYLEDTTYEEYYRGTAGSMWYDQSTAIDGSGFTMKLGAVLRPVKALRIGVAYHLPTYYTVDKAYNSTMSAVKGTYDSGETLVDEQRFNTAPRLLTGISYVIGDKAIVALDYECAWYNLMRIRSDYSRDVEDSKTESAEMYKPASTIRAGLEILASDIVSLRAGGSFMPNFLREKDAITNTPIVKSSWSATCGAGFNVGRNAYVDVSYIFNRASYSNYDLFYFDNPDTDTLVSQYDGVIDVNDTSRWYSPRKNLHQITLTLGSRF